MMRSTVVSIALFSLVMPASAQTQVGGNGAFLYEKYSFDSGLAYTDVSELTIPLTFSTYLGNKALFTLSTGATRVSLTGNPSAGLQDQEVSGIIDTEARLVLDLVPDRVSFLATAVAPTGIEALQIDEEAVLTALSSQVIGFSTTRLGGGGRAGAGFIGAFPVGDMALGVAGSYTHSLAYSPLVGQTSEWKPGGEIRIRAGLEGTVAPQSYLRVAAIFAARQADELDGDRLGEVGSQVHIYGSLNQGLQSSTLTLYMYDSYRSAPQIEATSIGAVRLPKGNLLALGAKLEIPIARQTRLIPKAEFRRLTEAPRDETGDGSLEAAGSTFRVGVDLKHPLHQTLALVFEANGLFGNVGAGNGNTVGVSGFRGGLHLEYRR
ncbi:MAG: hypothetical protein HKO65_09375 [Gemmatimonadetes bacterium]|nr:hypothetical protein [Gemmatimonadota bacterium]